MCSGSPLSLPLNYNIQGWYQYDNLKLDMSKLDLIDNFSGNRLQKKSIAGNRDNMEIIRKEFKLQEPVTKWQLNNTGTQVIFTLTSGEQKSFVCGVALNLLSYNYYPLSDKNQKKLTVLEVLKKIPAAIECKVLLNKKDSVFFSIFDKEYQTLMRSIDPNFAFTGKNDKHQFYELESFEKMIQEFKTRTSQACIFAYWQWLKDLDEEKIKAAAKQKKPSGKKKQKQPSFILSSYPKKSKVQKREVEHSISVLNPFSTNSGIDAPVQQEMIESKPVAPTVPLHHVPSYPIYLQQTMGSNQPEAGSPQFQHELTTFLEEYESWMEQTSDSDLLADISAAPIQLIFSDFLL